ncbi:ACP phosphodiesterase [Simiduia sp. 21SJ11W-1]|uniref:acyl carrier protein phosphodiesterase n=1 Tax=Simiduia sp. 21SJ11W-1 TaxID=2909669 RepID=UPI00209FC35A|nr:ACP phosphodiesterase [Simiduia sp. 21SJ11W-1]UTA48038.1 ACP phosphodiesterase [Simiduia sp. 21SJ11W-1]
MNYLAHLALSGPNPALRVGGFLGDWLKGPLHIHQQSWAPDILQGVALHRKIDAWVDQQAHTQAAITLLGPQLRRLAGPVLDITFDHFLARQFTRWHSQNLGEFCEEVHHQLAPHAKAMPEGAQRFLTRARDYQLFERYADQETYLGVIGSLRKRISRPQLLAGVEESLREQRPQLQAAFEALYPALQKFSEQARKKVSE